MDKDIIAKYSREMMDMYKRARPVVQYVADEPTYTDGFGNLIVNVTTLRGLYPVKSAEVTVFTGAYENMVVLDRDFTNDNGKTKTFLLSSPPKNISEQSGNTQIPYSLYSIRVVADGYREQINMNVPIFSGVTSLQDVDLTLVSASGNRTAPKITDENFNYDL